MADVKWIKLMTDMFDNRKIRQIECLPDGDAIIVIWVKLLCLAGIINDSGMVYLTKEIPYTEQMLATQFGRPLTSVQLALGVLQQFGMIEVIDDILKISNWSEYQNVEGMDKIREQTRKRVAKHRENKKLLECNDTCNVTVTQCNATEEERRKKKEDIEIDKENNTNIVHSKAEIDAFFDVLWNLYPVKKGKGQVSATARKRLYDIGMDEMQRAIHRYLSELQMDSDWRKPQNGSTFFNSGYIDYLDANYEPQVRSQATSKNKTADMLQESYDMMDEWAKVTEGKE